MVILIWFFEYILLTYCAVYTCMVMIKITKHWGLGLINRLFVYSLYNQWLYTLFEKNNVKKKFQLYMYCSSVLYFYRLIDNYKGHQVRSAHSYCTLQSLLFETRVLIKLSQWQLLISKCHLLNLIKIPTGESQIRNFVMCRKDAQNGLDSLFNVLITIKVVWIMTAVCIKIECQFECQ
jgi:hypothetical protein